MKKSHILICSTILATALFTINHSHAQSDRWQQRVNYKMDVIVDVQNNTFNGKQKLEYSNNSPDTLKTLYYHLYWNAFQPGSMMDVRSIELGKKMIRGKQDWDQRVRDRISKLSEKEIGYQRVNNFKVNGITQKTSLHETIMKVELSKPIPPRSKSIIELEFEAQVPVQIRRSGRDNAEGVRFSMAQWYPKLCEYDQDGWHPNPYIAREFYGIWGDFEVNITIDSSYVIGATGYLQNPHEIGHGYEMYAALPYKRSNSKDLTWKFKAPNVHDFVWAADPDYIHNSKKVRNGLILHSFYKIDSTALGKEYEKLTPKVKSITTVDAYISNYKQQWDSVLELAAKALPYIDSNFGVYPYKQYSFIQGGDGGMEYPMATLLKGAGKTVVIHEWMHSWYQMMLGTNESLYPWMDEGFTSFAESRVINYLKGNIDSFPHADAFDAYIALSKSEFNEPLTTHADHYSTNTAYSINSYAKGEVFMEQLGYIVGATVRDTIMKKYFDKWKYKHPNANDFIRLAENISGIELDWYRDFFVNTNKSIDYAIDSVWDENGKMNIRLRNLGNMPMPLDIEIKFKDGSREMAYIPQFLMFGIKQNEDPSIKRTVGEPWKWTHPTYTIQIERNLLEVRKIEIDPKKITADTERKNNKLELNW